MKKSRTKYVAPQQPAPKPPVFFISRPTAKELDEMLASVPDSPLQSIATKYERRHNEAVRREQERSALLNPRALVLPGFEVVQPLRHEMGVAANATRELLQFIGEDPDREGLKETPSRVAKAWKELTAGFSQDPADLFKTFEGEGYSEMVTLGPIEFFSTCEHHLLPFYGHAWVGYVPGTNGRIVGLSKLARLVELFSRRLQVQERLTGQVADTLMKHLGARGAACVVTGRHLCMMARGAKQQEASMTTSALRGVFMDNPQTRAEFLALTRR